MFLNEVEMHGNTKLDINFTNIRHGCSIKCSRGEDTRFDYDLHINFNPLSFIRALEDYQCELLAWLLIDKLTTAKMTNICLEYDAEQLRQEEDEEEHQDEY